MSTNESRMKERGETKVWNTIRTKTNKVKDIASIQLGQQIILEESLRILPEVRDWINNSSAKSYRKDLKKYFQNKEALDAIIRSHGNNMEEDQAEDQFLLTKITQVLLFLAGSINISESDKKAKRSNRHKKINTLRNRVMPELSFELTWRLTEVIVELSQYYNIEKLLNYDQQGFSWNLKYTCLLSDTILEKLTLEAAEAFYPMPMTNKPVDWSWSEESGIIGGYETYQYEMIRASREIDYSLYSKKIFDSVNYIQSTPWKVNELALEQVKLDLRVPIKSDFVKSEYPDATECMWDVNIKDESLDKDLVIKLEKERQKFRDQAELHNAEVGDYESAMGKYRAIKMATQIADKDKGQIVYFPHSFDFRGRVYPIPVGLSPQGSDAIKAMLEYANGEVLNRDGAEWAFAYLASLYGDDKLRFDDRVKRGMELIEADYKDADEPYQFLAHQIELIKVVNDPTLEFKGRIHLDACNSGSQFTSAITGDLDGCIATNVIPTFTEEGLSDRKDAYLLVAEKALELCERRIKEAQSFDEKEELEFFKSLLLENGRKICKTPVMVSNYGGTAGGRAEILWNMMREFGCDRKWITKKTSSHFATLIGDSITGVLNGGKAFESYIHKMNNAITKKNNPIWWTTSDGFNIVHVKHKELKSKQVSCLLPGGRKKTTIIKKVYSDNISVPKMRSAISPNYIHSLDAELLRRVALKMRNNGIEDSDWIHDSFGCHPNHVDEMLDITKREFMKIMKRTPLKKLDEELRSQSKLRKKRDKDILEKIKMPQLRGFNISAGDLDVVENSEWFFS